ncbi:o-acyltransferase wsd1 [Quercus suber]|uniref:O-acyltransferase wsd1 n=1 Tax=Quercus suber TaxID=58331 RepID=A0AAW0L325_QUESU
MANSGALIGEEALSPAAQLFQSPSLNCYIVTMIGFKTKINPNFVKAGLEQTLLKHPLFSSKIVDGKEGRNMKWIPTTVKLENHVFVPNLDPNIDHPDQLCFKSDQNSNGPVQTIMGIHLLNVKTSDAEAVGVFRIHHSIGDGASLTSLLIASTRKTSDPEALPTVPIKKRAGTNSNTIFWWILSIWFVLRLIWNTCVDFMLFLATFLFLKDTQSPIKGAPRCDLTTKRFAYRIVSLNDIKFVKNVMNMTINDVVLGATQAAAEDKKDGDICNANNLPESLRLRAIVFANIRATAGIQDMAEMMTKGSKDKWGNEIGYVIFPLTIALHGDPLKHIGEVKAKMERKKLSLEAQCTLPFSCRVLKTFGVKAAAALTHTVFTNTTVAFSNVCGPLEEISFFGHSIAFLAPSIYGFPHAITIHCQSYADKMTIILAADPNVVPDPHLLLDDLEESLQLIKDAALKKGSSKLLSEKED